MKTFGEIIKRAREKRKISQETLAGSIKNKYNVRLSTSYLSMIETNTRTNLTINLINALLEYLELPPETAYSLFARTDRDNPMLKSQDPSAKEDGQTALDAMPAEVQKALEDLQRVLTVKYSRR